MTGQEMKALANDELDRAAVERRGRPLTIEERMKWWCSPQAGVEEPYLLTIGGTEEQRRAIVQAAKGWSP